MRSTLELKRDFFAGGLLVLIGSAAVLEGTTYDIGTLMRMGPGFMPVSLGGILVILGIFIAGSAAVTGDDDQRVFTKKPQWLSWLCIIGGPFLFIVLGIYGGLIPATFACVFVSAFADRTATLKSSFVLAAATTVVAIVLFDYLLQIQFPLLQWG